MAKRTLTLEKRALIVAFRQVGLSIREIAKKIKVPRSTVFDTIKRFSETKSNIDRKRSGRSKITTNAEDKSIVLESKRCMKKTAPEIQADFNRSHEKNISVSTVQRRLRSAGLYGRIAVRKPLLRAINKKKRLVWAKQHKDWTLDQWKNVLWSDESKFEIFGNKRRTFVRRNTNEKFIDSCLEPTIKHGGGSVMVWGCFYFNGVGRLHQIRGKMDQKVYGDILQNHVLSSGQDLIGRGFVFQHDNDPKHTSKLCKTFLGEKESSGELNLMIWPPQSPDLNPIELLWDELDRNVPNKYPSSSAELWSLLNEAWVRIPKKTIEKLIERMPRIVNMVIKTRGGFFDEKKV